MVRIMVFSTIIELEWDANLIKKKKLLLHEVIVLSIIGLYKNIIMKFLPAFVWFDWYYKNNC